jgi:hypothetical protein
LVTAAAAWYFHDCGRCHQGSRTVHLNKEFSADKSFAIALALAQSSGMRISRNNQVIGDWSSDVALARLESGEASPTDSFYDEDTSEWLPLSGLAAKLIAAKPAPKIAWPCYCGSRLPFTVCCGDGNSDT